ncbi:hypothetical protein TNCV_166651 [Trichonephila clavipes]|nr:hypothetical protein TNCV_166651 [Trichonephila clavipes]
MSSNTRCLNSEGIQRLVWPARSPDLNPIENAWDALRRQVAGRNYPPTNKNTLIRALTEEWDKLLNSCWIMLCKYLDFVHQLSALDCGNFPDLERHHYPLLNLLEFRSTTSSIILPVLSASGNDSS